MNETVKFICSIVGFLIYTMVVSYIAYSIGKVRWYSKGQQNGRHYATKSRRKNQTITNNSIESNTIGVLPPRTDRPVYIDRKNVYGTIFKNY